jgi:hypothetical protein
MEHFSNDLIFYLTRRYDYITAYNDWLKDNDSQAPEEVSFYILFATAAKIALLLISPQQIADFLDVFLLNMLGVKCHSKGHV